MQKIDTTIDRLAKLREGEIAKDGMNFPLSYSIPSYHPFSGSMYFSSNNQVLYKIKADGTVELGDLILEAVIKGLEKKGYYLIKVGGSTFPLAVYTLGTYGWLSSDSANKKK